MSSITTHILDTSRGRPAAGVAVTVSVRKGDTWVVVGSGATDDNGRVTDLLGKEPLEAATYRLAFATAAYLGPNAFYPEVVVVFEATPDEAHYHVPLLLGPFGYTTYRGT